MLDSLKTKTPLSKIITAALCTLMTGELIGATSYALDVHDTDFATMCGIISVITLLLVVLYWYSIFKTVDFKDKLSTKNKEE